MESGQPLDVPIVREENICLPLVVSAVAKYWGTDLPMSEAAEIAKKYPGVRGSILIEGVELAERHGLAGMILNLSMKDLRRLITIGMPVIVILPGIRDVVQHASLVIGYDEAEGAVFHYIPEPDKIGAIPEEAFDRQWQEDDRLAIVLAPPDVMSEARMQHDARTKSNRMCFEAEKLRLQGRAGEAVSMLREALASSPANSTASCLYGGILNDMNSPEAVSQYRKSIESNPRCYLAYRGLGNYFLKRKEYESADRCYTEAIGINAQRFVPIFKNRGIARMELGRNREAREDLEKYLAAMPDAQDAAAISQAISELG